MQRIDLYTRALFVKARALIATAFVLLSLASIAFMYAVWERPLEFPPARVKTAARKGADAVRAAERGAYSVIADKDLFSPARKAYSAPPKVVKAEPPPPPPPPKPPPPRLKLAGTVLLNDGEAALIEFAGSNQSPGYYRVGDSIEGFIVREIGKGGVSLERDGETLKVTMSGSQAGSGAERGERQRDIPAGLVPARR